MISPEVCVCKHSVCTLTAIRSHVYTTTRHARDRHSRPCLQALSMHTSNEHFVQTSVAMHQTGQHYMNHHVDGMIYDTSMQITFKRDSQLCES
jgi:hypothetical protein